MGRGDDSGPTRSTMHAGEGRRTSSRNRRGGFAIDTRLAERRAMSWVYGTEVEDQDPVAVGVARAAATPQSAR